MSTLNDPFRPDRTRRAATISIPCEQMAWTATSPDDRTICSSAPRLCVGAERWRCPGGEKRARSPWGGLLEAEIDQSLSFGFNHRSSGCRRLQFRRPRRCDEQFGTDIASGFRCRADSNDPGPINPHESGRASCRTRRHPFPTTTKKRCRSNRLGRNWAAGDGRLGSSSGE